MELLKTILITLFTLGILVSIHEFGHFGVARRCGVRVLRFSVGCGRALWRRARRPEEPAGQIACAGFVLEPEAGVLTLPCGRVVELARYEVEILRRLLAAPGKVVPRSRLLDEIWGWGGETTTRVVDFHVGNLRRKVEPDPARPTHILTAHGRGYRWAGG